MNNVKDDMEVTVNGLVVQFVIETKGILLEEGKIDLVENEILFQLMSVQEIIEYVMNDTYWSCQWSCFLISVINNYQRAA